MLKKNLLKYLFALLILALYSCSTSKFVVDVTKPPSIEIPFDIVRILQQSGRIIPMTRIKKLLQLLSITLLL